VFPSVGFNSSNYWVDVLLVPSAALTSIGVTPTNPAIQAGDTQPLTATGTYSDGSTQKHHKPGNLVVIEHGGRDHQCLGSCVRCGERELDNHGDAGVGH